jgi:hypothetical protein
METWMFIATGAAVLAGVLLIAGLGIWIEHRRGVGRTTDLKEGFGPEYAKAVQDQGRSDAEDDLVKRQERAGALQLRPLSEIEVVHYNETWMATQVQFVDEPGAALTAADHLVTEIIGARGYPVAEFEQGASALSVDHPGAVQDYRAAHEVAVRNQGNPVPPVPTDILRAAMKQFRTVFTELVDGVPSRQPAPAG